MPKKKKAEKHLHTTQAVKQKNRTTPIPKWHIPLILLITFIAYIPSLSADFVNWDDGDYVLDNPMIRDVSRLGELMTTHVQGNHHPLTMLSMFFNYMISGNDAWSYHLFNILFHLVNCYLVYRLAFLLSYKRSLIAFITSLFFAIHPLHVESVAWISERKDLLYTLFFMAGHIAFLKYIDSGSRKQYWLAFLFLLLSLASKPAAVIFPVSLFCIDFLRSRKLSFKLILEKAPFFIASLAMGIITVLAQKDAGATEGDPFGMVNNILFGFYGILMYFIKMIFPFGLSAFYPFPPINENLPFIYYLSPLFAVALIVVAWITRNKYRFVPFGIGFYIVNLVLVLQIFSVGSAVIAERYTYVPYIGLFYIAGCFLDNYSKGKESKAYFIILPVASLLTVLTFIQSQTWKNGTSLWDSVIKNHPSSRAYSARATIFRKEKNYDKAIEYYTEAIRMNVIDHESYNNRANIYMDINKFDQAYSDYKNAIRIKPDYHIAFDNIGSLLARKNQFDSAIFYLNKAIQLQPDYHPAYSNRALCYMSLKRYPEAITDWHKVLQYEPDAADVVNTIGLCTRLIGKFQEAIPFINRAIEMDPQGPFYLNRSYTYLALNNREQARNDAITARQKGAPVDAAYLKSLGVQ